MNTSARNTKQAGAPAHEPDRGPERELLLTCARALLRPDGISAIDRLVKSGVDWPYLLEMADRHGLTPLLHSSLGDCACPDAIPLPIRQALMDWCRSNAIATLASNSELCRIHKKLQDEHIALVPFKGPIFGEYAYGNSCLRPFCDLDFLINKQDFARAKTLLLAEGYQAEFHLDRNQEAAHLRFEPEYCFNHPGKNIRVELHWSIVRSYASFGLSAEEVWDHLVPFEFFNRQIMIPSPEYMLLILVVHHGGKHQWERLGWILDVAQLIASCKQLDWERVTSIAARKGMSRALGLGLYLARDLLSLELPQSVSARVQADSAIRSLAAHISTRLFANGGSPPAKLDHLMFSLKVRERIVDKMKYCFAQLVTSDHEDRERLCLPEPFSPLYGFMRLARWLRS